MPSYCQCFICREWSWGVSKCFNGWTELCLPCYVDVMEVRQRRGGSMGEPVVTAGKGGNTATPEEATIPGSAPSPDPLQVNMFGGDDGYVGPFD